MRESEVKEMIGEDKMDAFMEFMIGQTIGIYEDGEFNYYKCDVENFIHLQKTGKVKFFD